jgi:hypothetical protein
MKKIFIAANAFCKHMILLARPHVLFGFLRKPLLFFSNILSLSSWISRQPKKGILNDFFSLKRDYNKRYLLYQHVVDSYHLEDETIDYLELGVCGGQSFEWWLASNKNPGSRFYGFDTFEGLPENWGVFFNKGDMYAQVPKLNDSRAEFIKGLFQETLIPFLQTHPLVNGNRKLIHLDADLFSSTLFSLATLFPYLKKNDILFFDEFNVPNHECYALKIFTEAFYVQTELIGAVNNYYQVALIVK